MKAKMRVMKMLALVLLATAAGSLVVQAQPRLISPIPATTPPPITSISTSTPPPIPSNLPTNPIFPPPIDTNLPIIPSIPTPPVDPSTLTPPPVDPSTLTPPPPVDPSTLTPPPVDPSTLTPPPVDPSTLIPPPAPGTSDLVPPPNPETPPSPSAGSIAGKQALCAASCGFQCHGVGGGKNKTTNGFFGRLPLPRIPRIPFFPRPKPKPTPSLPKPTPTLPHPTPTLPIPGAPVLPFPVPPGFRVPKIPPGVTTAACYGVCMTSCNMQTLQSLDHCTARCAYNSITHHSVNTEDADEVNKHVDSCYNKCQKNSQAFETTGLDIEKDY